MPLRVYIADDQPMFVLGLRLTLNDEPDIETCGEATNAASALTGLRKAMPDVAVLSRLTPSLDVIRELAQEIRILMLTATANEDLVYAALQLGARGFLLKTAGRDEIIDSIKRVANEETVVADSCLGGLSKSIRRASVDGDLSPREIEVLTLAAHGKKAEDIAKELYIARSTVKSHLRNIYRKLEVTNMAAAVAETLRRGIIK